MVKKLACYTDASFRSKSLASTAYAIIDVESEKVLGEAAKIVQCKNVYDAELRALHRGLVHIRKMSQKGLLEETTELKVYCDNQSIVLAVNGRCERPKYAIMSCVVDELMKISSCHNIELIWISREENQLVDKLANEAVKKELERRANRKKALEREKLLEQKTESYLVIERQERLFDAIEKLADEIRANKALMSRILLRQQVQKNVRALDMECLWSVLEYYEGQEFYTVSGKKFTYRITDDSMKVKNIKIAKVVFSKVLCQLPVRKPCELGNVLGKSYVFSVLSDNRIGVNAN